jgi:hypothetical protein
VEENTRREFKIIMELCNSWKNADGYENKLEIALETISKICDFLEKHFETSPKLEILRNVAIESIEFFKQDETLISIPGVVNNFNVLQKRLIILEQSKGTSFAVSKVQMINDCKEKPPFYVEYDGWIEIIK